MLVVASEHLIAQSFSPGTAITDRPSSQRLPIPKYQPDNNQPKFTLPPAQPRHQPEQPDQQFTLVVKEFTFSGHTVFSTGKLQALAEPFLNTPITAAELEQLRRILTRLYIEHGYLNSGAILPKQVFRDGRIQFQIIEGELSGIQVSGTEWLDVDYVKNRLQLGAGPPLNSQHLHERYQLLLTDPLIERMDGRLRPGQQPGQSILDVQVVRAKPYGLSLSFDNYRPPSTGALQGQVDGWLRNLTGYGDLINLSLGHGKERFEIASGFTMPLNRYDTTFSFFYSNQQSTIQEKPLGDLDINNRFRSLEFALWHPVYRSLTQRVNLGSRLALRHIKNKLSGRRFSFSAGEEQGESKATALRFFQEFVDSRAHQVVVFRSTFSLGVSWFDATWHGDERPDSDYFAWLGQFQYVRQVLNDTAQLRFRANLQLADDPLLPQEQYAAGGVYSVRGYRENELVRDQGYNVSAEFHYPLFEHMFGVKIPGHLAVVPFTDYGAAWNRGNDNHIDHLLGMGIGLVWTHPRFNAEIYYAHDLIQASQTFEHDLQDTSVYFRISAFLL